MIDITERGYKALKTTLTIPYHNLCKREKVDIAILSHVWDERELAGGPIDDIDNYAVVRSLMRQNPLWARTTTTKLVEDTIPKLVYTKLLEQD